MRGGTGTVGGKFYADELHTEHKIKNSITLEDEITGRKIIWVEKDKTKDYKIFTSYLKSIFRKWLA